MYYLNNLEFKLAEKTELNEIINFYHSFIGTSGCTWHLDYPNEEIVRNDIDSQSLYTLRDKENTLVAVAAAGKSDELLELEWSLKKPCDLARIGVALALQGQGFGTIMLKQVINAVAERGFDGIRMLVNKNNPAALALYNKNGFRKCGETRMYDRDFFCYEMNFNK